MTTSRNLLVWLVLTMTACFPLRAASPPGVDAILDRFVAASGGAQVLAKLKSALLVGDLEFMGTTAPSNWVMRAKGPDKQTTDLDMGAFGHLTEGFDGSVAWGRNGGEPVRVKAGDELARAKREATFQGRFRLKSLHPDLAFEGTRKLDGKDVYVLGAKPTATSRERYLFSAETGLLVQQESELVGQPGKVVVITRYSDYRAVDGLKYPFSQKIQLSAGGQDLDVSLKLRTVRHNENLPDSLFAKPSS